MKHIKIGELLINPAHITHIAFDNKDYDFAEKKYIPAIIIYLISLDGQIGHYHDNVGAVEPCQLVFREGDYDLNALKKALLALFEYDEIENHRG